MIVKLDLTTMVYWWIPVQLFRQIHLESLLISPLLKSEIDKYISWSALSYVNYCLVDLIDDCLRTLTVCKSIGLIIYLTQLSTGWLHRLEAKKMNEQVSNYITSQ